MWWNISRPHDEIFPHYVVKFLPSHKRRYSYSMRYNILQPHKERLLSVWWNIPESRKEISMRWNIPQPHKEIFPLHVVEYSPAHSIWWDRVESGDLLSLSVFNVGYLAGKCGNRGFYFGGSVYVRTELTADRTFIKYSSWKLNTLLLKISRHKEKHFSQMVYCYIHC